VVDISERCKGKTVGTLDIVPLYEAALSKTEVLRYGMPYHWITQFYLPLTHFSRNGMNHTCLSLPNQSCSSFTDPRGKGWKAELA